MAEAKTLHDAFLDELRDSYDAEKQLTKAQDGEGREVTGTPGGVRIAPRSDGHAKAADLMQETLDEEKAAPREAVFVGRERH